MRDVSGEWRLATHVESSSLPAFTGLRLGYDLQLTQAGNGITGTGRKLSENGATLGPAAQTPISVEGTITRDRVTLTFTEQGTERQIRGKFVLLADEDGTLRGRFSSTAAQSSGIVEAHRIPR